MESDIPKKIVKIVDKDSHFYGTGFFIQLQDYDIPTEKYCVTCHHCIARLI